MSKTEAIETFAKAVFEEDKSILSPDEFTKLVATAKNQEERDFYVYVYNYLLQLRQKEVMASEKY